MLVLAKALQREQLGIQLGALDELDQFLGEIAVRVLCDPLFVAEFCQQSEVLAPVGGEVIGGTGGQSRSFVREQVGRFNW